jgi:DnaJ family protein A protein 5
MICLQSFFSVYRNLFLRLSAEEAVFMSNQNYPSFGLSTWPWTVLKQDDRKCARDFYNVWMNFTTEKDFSWMEQWNLAEAPERRVRRYTKGSSLLAFCLNHGQIDGKRQQKITR